MEERNGEGIIMIQILRPKNLAGCFDRSKHRENLFDMGHAEACFGFDTRSKSKHMKQYKTKKLLQQQNKF